jgi:hypothetical protein
MRKRSGEKRAIHELAMLLSKITQSILSKISLSVVSSIQYPASCSALAVTNIQYPVSSIQYPISNI